MAQVVERLLCKEEALYPNPDTTKHKEGRQGGREEGREGGVLIAGLKTVSDG
jgi:hypothetical protein